MWIFLCGKLVGRKLALKSVRNSTLFCRKRFASKTLTFTCSRQNAALWAANFRPIINNKKARLKTLLFSFTGRLFCCNLTDCLKKFQLHQSFLMAHLRSILMLLPSGPDMVRRDKLHKTLISSSKVFAHIRPNYP